MVPKDASTREPVNFIKKNKKLLNDKKRKAHGSSDEDSIVMQIGSFVNSLWSDSKEKKEAKKVKKVDVQTM